MERLTPPAPNRRIPALPVVIGLGLVAAAVAMYFRLQGLSPGNGGKIDIQRFDGEIEAVRPQVTLFCGNCHAVPSPAGFPKVAWHEEVSKGFEFYTQSGRTDLEVPPLERVVKYFRSQAPDTIVIPPARDDPSPPPIRFRAAFSSFDTPPRGSPPAIAFLTWGALSFGEPPVLLACDMGAGYLRAGRPNRDAIAFDSLVKLDNPVHAVPIDLDADGQLDLVVADLGSRLPADHTNGRVVWLRRQADMLETIVIQDGLGRVADVEPGDFDGDGDLDLIVAEFGWHTTGRIVLLENRMTAGGPPQFKLHIVDRRPGAIHVPVADLNGDGRLDFVALVSQEHETVEAFLNEGDNRFRHETIFAAGEPAFGSSGIELVDIDQDGDLDVLYTNGDTFDSFYLKPYHSIRWFENLGNGDYAAHLLAAMPGVHRALAGDLDGDGDLDIAACALIPRKLFGQQPGTDFDALLWLEQIAPGKFARHSLQRAGCDFAALALGDFDDDGKLDIAVGHFANGTNSPPGVTVWWNEGPSTAVGDAWRPPR